MISAGEAIHFYMGSEPLAGLITDAHISRDWCKKGIGFVIRGVAFPHSEAAENNRELFQEEQGKRNE